MSSEFASRVSDLQLVSAQRWVFGLLSVAAAMVASIAASVSDGGGGGPLLLLVAAFAIVTLVRPDSHVGLLVVAIVIAQCVANDDTTTPWMIVVAVGLLLFHTITAVSAITPLDATIDEATLRRWTSRLAVAGVATVAMWVLVEVLARRDAAGSVVLTFVGFVILIVLLAGVRAVVVRSADESR